MSDRKKKRSRVRWGRILLVLALLVVLALSVARGLKRLSGKEPDARQEAVSVASENTVLSEDTPTDVSEGVPEQLQEGPEQQTEPEEEPAPAEPEQPAVDLTAWNMILANPWNALPDDFAAPLTSVYGGYQVDERIVEDLTAMFDAAAAEGVDLMICSAYRSVSYQQGLFERKVNEYIGYGYSQEQATTTAATIVAVPGTSEHHTGLALDIVTPSHQVLDDAFADTEAAEWLKANAPDYGFILRYPADKTVQTGIIFEPWHYRYVGRDYARSITDTGLCFEEWLDTVS